MRCSSACRRSAWPTPGVKDAIAFPGLSIAGFTNSPNAGIVFIGLDDFENRRTPELSGKAIQEALQQKFFMEFGNALVLIFQPPPVNGLGTIGGFKMQIQDRASLGYPALYKATQDLMNKARQDPKLAQDFFELRTQRPPAPGRRRPRESQVAARPARRKSSARCRSISARCT